MMMINVYDMKIYKVRKNKYRGEDYGKFEYTYFVPES